MSHGYQPRPPRGDTSKVTMKWFVSVMLLIMTLTMTLTLTFAFLSDYAHQVYNITGCGICMFVFEIGVLGFGAMAIDTKN